VTGRAAPRPRASRIEAPLRGEGVHVEARHGGASILVVRKNVARWDWLDRDEIGPVAAELLALLPPEDARALLGPVFDRLAAGRSA
jgi:hypothetical protein